MRISAEILTLLLVMIILSCESKNEEDLFGQKKCDTLNVTFSGDFQPILESICHNCHHSGATQYAPFVFDTYDDVKLRIDQGRLEGAINHRQGFSPMPKNRDKLPDCNLAKINAWINQGAPDN
jgi:hypothetical protein